MTAVISVELLKLRTIRAPWLVAGAMVALVGVVLGFNASLLGDPGQPAMVPSVLGDLARAPGRLTGAAALLIGLLLSTTEYRHATVLTSRLAYPAVTGSVLGKAVAATLAGALLAAAVEVAMIGGTAVVLAANDVAVQPLRHGVPGAVGATLAVAALHGVAGVGVGELVRNPALAVGSVLGWAFVVEGVLPVLLREPDLDRWLPTGAAQAALALGTRHDPATLGPVVALAVLAAWAAGLLGAGLGRARRTDP